MTLPATLFGDDELGSFLNEDSSELSLSLEREHLKLDLYDFLVAVWPIVEPSQPFTPNWHIRVLCKLLQDIALGHEPCARWIVNISPGTMKSLLISVIFPAWIWARSPKKRFLTASYGQHLTVRDNLRVRDIIQSPWFQKRFPIKLVEDQNTKTRYNTENGGWRIATSVDGVGTGEHPDFIIIDDPTTAGQAQSEPERMAANNWFDRTISSRGVARGVTIIVVMQRLHEDDLTGHLLKRGGWGHVRLPMRFEKCTCLPVEGLSTVEPEAMPADQRCPLHKADLNWKPDPRDTRTDAGELMFPALFDEGKVAQLERDLGPYGTAGQLQQRPAPEGGGLFKREWFKYCEAIPAIVRRVRGWDTAGTEDDGDYTVGVKLAEGFEWRASPDDPSGLTKVLVSTGQFFVEHVVRGQWGPGNVDKMMLATAKGDTAICPIREEKEGGGSGKAVIAAHLRLLVGFDYKEIQLGTNKIVRAKAFRAQCEGGNVFLLRAPWNEEFITELCNFPTGKHDDQVDAASCAFNAVLLEPPPNVSDCVW